MATRKTGKFITVISGCGGMAGGWLRNKAVKRNARVVGFMDVNIDAAKKRAGEFGDKNAVVGTDLARIIKETGAEVLLDCSIPEAHYKNTMTALKLGLHVMGEKPMADTMPHAQAMLAAAKKANRVYAVMQNRRYLKGIQRVRNALEAGVIGTVHTVQTDFFTGPHFGGFRDKMKHPLILDMAIHTFDAARFVSGADAKAVYCRAFNPAGSWYAHGASANAIFEMTKGITYVYNGSWCNTGRHTSWQCDWRIIGTKGAITWNGDDEITCEVSADSDKWLKPVQEVRIPKKYERKRVGGHTACINEFFEAVRSGRKPMTYCADNIRSLAMVHSAIKSDALGKRIVI
jgi:predicted dehydrogenase